MVVLPSHMRRIRSRKKNLVGGLHAMGFEPGPCDLKTGELPFKTQNASNHGFVVAIVRKRAPPKKNGTNKLCYINTWMSVSRWISDWVGQFCAFRSPDATANWIPNGTARNRPRAHPAPTPDPPPEPPQGPQGHKKNVLQILFVFERSDGHRHPAHVGSRLGSPAPCTRGTRCSSTSPRQPNTQYGVSGRRGAAALPSL
jgi:hypothetical protein